MSCSCMILRPLYAALARVSAIVFCSLGTEAWSLWKSFLISSMVTGCRVQWGALVLTACACTYRGGRNWLYMSNIRSWPLKKTSTCYTYTFNGRVERGSYVFSSSSSVEFLIQAVVCVATVGSIFCREIFTCKYDLRMWYRGGTGYIHYLSESNSSSLEKKKTRPSD